MRRHPPWPAS
ncbi:unnamed protein product [Linum tenue]|uniref:Uncharacterized protein n=1 Tax=Linum tenue TaxID=586396 RepID=A0AAV0LDS3_9ROSI|nr:unnamed protein product [Linum tenue]